VHARSFKQFFALFFAMLMLAACAETAEHRGTGQVVDDAAITAHVKAAFAKSPDVDAMDINVDTYKGVVQLTGFADSSSQIQKASEIARNVDGVQSVKNDIRLKSTTGANY
jgi:osmotically-inducible protein OsmY